MLVRAGPVWENPQNNGISHFLEHMLFRGVPEHPSATALGLALDEAGSEANAATYSDMTVVTLKALPEMAEPALKLLCRMVQEPVFEGLPAEKRIILEECLEDMDEDGQLVAIDQLSSQLMYGDHVYALPILGTATTVEAINRQRLREYLARYYRPANAVVLTSGQIEPKQAVAIAKRVFGDWSDPVGTEPLGKTLPVPEFRGPKILRVRSARSQITCRVSFRALAFSDPEYFVEKAILRILDAASGSPLRQALQDRGGYCYSLSAGVDAYDKAGAVHVDLNLQPDRLLDGLEELLKVFNRLARRGFTEEETDRMIAQYLKGKRFSANDLWDFSGRYGFRALYPTPLSFEDEFSKTQELTAADLTNLGRRLFRRQNIGITMVGPVTDRQLRAVRALTKSFPE